MDELLGRSPAVFAAVGMALAALLLGAFWLGRRGPERARRRLELELERTREALRGEALRQRDREVLLERAEASLRDAFRALAGEALGENGRAFLEMAREALREQRERAEGALRERESAIEGLVAPLRRSLERVDARLGEVEKAREGAYQALREQIRTLAQTEEQLRAEAQRLSSALRSPTARGRWGELQLRRVVELAGLSRHCDFQEQPVASGERALRPDLVVRLPGGRSLVVDAKAPLSAYLRALDSRDEQERARHLADHAARVRAHLAALSARSYRRAIPGSADFVVMFLPGETFFAAALEEDPSLLEFGVERGVIPASPTTLIALLRAVAIGWQQEQVAASAAEIADLGRTLYERLGVLARHFGNLRRGLDRAVAAYNEAAGSFEGRVMVAARRLAELGATGEELEAPGPVERSPRPPPPPPDPGPPGRGGSPG